MHRTEKKEIVASAYRAHLEVDGFSLRSLIGLEIADLVGLVFRLLFLFGAFWIVFTTSHTAWSFLQGGREGHWAAGLALFITGCLLILGLGIETTVALLDLLWQKVPSPDRTINHPSEIVAAWTGERLYQDAFTLFNHIAPAHRAILAEGGRVTRKGWSFRDIKEALGWSQPHWQAITDLWLSANLIQDKGQMTLATYDQARAEEMLRAAMIKRGYLQINRVWVYRG